MKMHWPDVVGYQNSRGSNGFTIWKGKGTMSTVCRQYSWGHWQLNDCNFGRKFGATTQSFWEVPKLPIFVFEHATHTACLLVTLVCRKVTGPKPNCLLWPYNLCISTTKWLCGFFRGVCLHCREMGTICMCYGKQKNLSVNLAMWLQVVMSFSICMLLHNVWPLVVWFNILVTSMVPTWTLGQQNQKVYNQ